MVISLKERLEKIPYQDFRDEERIEAAKRILIPLFVSLEGQSILYRETNLALATFHHWNASKDDSGAGLVLTFREILYACIPGPWNGLLGVRNTVGGSWDMASISPKSFGFFYSGFSIYPDPTLVQEAADAFRAGEVETGYGLLSE